MKKTSSFNLSENAVVALTAAGFLSIVMLLNYLSAFAG